MALLKRGEMRDACRRMLHIVPPIDDPEAFPDARLGDAPEYAPDPTNATINMQIEGAVADINLASGSNFLTGLVRVPVAAQTDLGALRISLEGDQFVGAGAWQINQVRDAWWEIAATDDASTPATRLLRAADLDTLAREEFRYQSYAPGLPYRYAIEGYAVWLVPAPVAAGTLVLRAGLGVFAPLHDQDTLRQFPADCASAFMDLVAANVVGTMLDDAGMQDLARYLIPKAATSEKLILRTLAMMHGKLDGHMTVATYRAAR